MRDEIVEELHRFRKALAVQCGFDLKRMLAEDQNVFAEWIKTHPPASARSARSDTIQSRGMVDCV